MAGTLPPVGLGRRARRLSDRETEQRMLATAVGMVERTGLTVSLDHLSLEEVIRAAGVSRSAVYRRWPYKDLFVSDLVRELARTATPGLVDDELALLHRLLDEHGERLDSPGGRQELLLELFRQEALLDFEAVSGSPAWRTYLALLATYVSLADEGLRTEVGAALARTEEAHTARVAASWRQLTTLFGYRLRPEAGITFEDLTVLLNAVLRGLCTMALSTPAVASTRRPARPFGATRQAEWSLPGLGLGALAWSMLEPDPAVEWTADRAAAVRRALAEWEPPPA